MGKTGKNTLLKEFETVFRILPVLGKGKMGHDPRYSPLGNPVNPVKDLGDLGREKAKTPHPGVDLEVEVQGLPGRRKGFKKTDLVPMMKDRREFFPKTEFQLLPGKPSEKDDRAGIPSSPEREGFIRPHDSHLVDAD